MIVLGALDDQAVRGGLVWGLVGREADVPVLAEHPHVTSELVGELFEHRFERAADVILEGRAIGVEVLARVVGLEPAKPRERLRRKAPELQLGRIGAGHRRSVADRDRRRSGR